MPVELVWSAENSMTSKLLTTTLSPELSRQLPSPLDIPFTALPQPSRDINVLRSDLHRSGFCYIQDALSTSELITLNQRLNEQMEAEVEAGISSHDGGESSSEVRNNFWKDKPREQPNQKVLMLINKGECFQDLVTKQPLAERLVDGLLGKKWILSSLWANIARPGGQPMPMHCDQGGAMPRFFKRSASLEKGGAVPKGYRGADAYDHTAQQMWDVARTSSDGKFTTESLVSCMQKMKLPEFMMPPVYCQVVYFLTDVVSLCCCLYFFIIFLN